MPQSVWGGQFEATVANAPNIMAGYAAYDFNILVVPSSHGQFLSVGGSNTQLREAVMGPKDMALCKKTVASD